jgi:ketosteroid isomerase-like protein
LESGDVRPTGQDLTAAKQLRSSDVAEQAAIFKHRINSERYVASNHRGSNLTQINQASIVENLEKQRYDAMLAGDVETLRKLCSVELAYTHSSGERDDKESYLAKIASGFFTYHEIIRSVDRILMLDEAALVMGRMTARGTVEGVARQIDNAYLAVWAREADGWKFVAYQPTPLRRP